MRQRRFLSARRRYCTSLVQVSPEGTRSPNRRILLRILESSSVKCDHKPQSCQIRTRGVCPCFPSRTWRWLQLPEWIHGLDVRGAGGLDRGVPAARRHLGVSARAAGAALLHPVRRARAAPPPQEPQGRGAHVLRHRSQVSHEEAVKNSQSQIEATCYPQHKLHIRVVLNSRASVQQFV